MAGLSTASSAGSKIRAKDTRPWWTLLQNPRGFVLGALVLSYVWRWHDITPGVESLRLGAVATILAWAFLVLDPRLPQIRRALRLPYIRFLVLWYLWMVFGTIGALDPSLSRDFLWSNYFKTLTMLFFIVGFADRIKTVRSVVFLHIAGASVVAFYYAKSGFPRTWSPVSMYDPNDLAFAFTTVVPLALFGVLVANGGRLTRITPRIIMLGLTTCAILSQSRGAFLALFASFALVFLRAGAVPQRVRLAAPLILVLVVVLAPSEVRDRLMTLTELESDYNNTSETGRMEIWKRGLTSLGERPIAGFGAASFGVVDAIASGGGRRGGKAAHNSFLQVAVESGLVGLTLFLGIITSALWRLRRLRRRLKSAPMTHTRETVLLVDMLSVSLVAYIVGGFFLSQGYSVILVLLVSLIPGLETETPARTPVIGGRRAVAPQRTGTRNRPHV